MQPRLLIIEDSPDVLKMLTTLFRREYELVTAVDGQEGLDQFIREDVHAVVVDYKLPKMTGIEFIEKAMKVKPEIPVIMVTAHGSIQMAVEAMKLGAVNYLTKPLNLQEMRLVVKQAVERFQLVQENRKLRKEIESQYGFDRLIGKSHSMQRIYDLVRNIQNTSANVLIAGEPGSGKELLARIIHYNSSRKNKPFIRVDCTALKEKLLESDLFGHVSGAFEEAATGSEGAFEKAQGGTVFLKHVQALPLTLQAKLLRVLQEGNFEPVGSSKAIESDVRVICGTGVNLKRKHDEGQFRQDLLYRISVVSVEVPALRDRSEDVPMLAEHFLKIFAQKNEKNVRQISKEAKAQLFGYPWPGNVRELEHTMEHAVVVCQGDTITRNDLSLNDPSISFITKEMKSLDSSLEGPEKQIILNVLEQTNWSRKRTAEILEITRATLYNKMKKYDLKRI